MIYWPLIHTTLHTLRITTRQSSPACSVFTSRCLVTAFKNGGYSAYVITSLMSGEYPTTKLSTELQRHLFSVSLAELNSQLIGSESETETYVTTDGQSASLSWCQAPMWVLRPDTYYCLTVAGLLMLCVFFWREDGSAVCNCCWPSLRVPWDSRQ
jgi:hypothetical protein